MEPVRVKKLRQSATMPTYGSPEAAGADLYACISEDVVIEPGCTAFIPTGLSIQLPVGTAGLIYARSGLACKHGLAPANKVGVIDSDYRGEVMIALYNHGQNIQRIAPGDRIAQLIVTPVYTPEFLQEEELSETQRAEGGFGSTGK